MKKFIVIFCVVILTGCSYDNTPQSIPSESQSESIVESSEDDTIKLNDDEQIILDCLIENSSLFNYPAEMRLLEIGKEEIIEPSDKFPQGRHYVYVKLQGENKLGGKVSHFYQLYLDDCSFVSSPTFTLYFYKGQMELWESSVNPIVYKSKTVDVSKINKSLKAYWEDLGL